jgi:ribose 5-phosphate isomerase RpiB
MKIIIGSDHAGFDLKEQIRSFLSEKGEHTVKDIRTFNHESADYPIIAHEAARSISEKRFNQGSVKVKGMYISFFALCP